MFVEAYVAKVLSEYLEMMQPVILIFHLAYLVLVNRLVLFGNEFRTRFELFVTLHYIMFLFFPSGYLWVQLSKLGPAAFARTIDNGIPLWLPGPSFALSGVQFILTMFLSFLWFSEARAPQNDYDFRKIRWWSYAVVPVILWGFVYPFQQTAEPGRFIFLGFSGLWSSPFGVLLTPTSTFLLGLLTLIYPRVNFRLFIGSASALLLIALMAARSSPFDWPLVVLAGLNLILGMVYLLMRRAKRQPTENAETISDPHPDPRP
ncbi:MAG: hypothetical protein HY282_07575 [Nitrospirae bacterium]|nr:hypothetical protein [Candidatus Manganitrophaceae bacterium]